MDPLLEALLLRRKSHGAQVGGMQLASDWMGAVVPCLTDAACDLELHKEASADQWLKAVKDAQQKTTHTSPDCLILGSKSLATQLGVRQIPALTAGACMDYYTIMTSVNEDRDEDVMHPKGAQIDPAMPVLMYHNPIWPVGKLEKVLDQNDKWIEIHNSLIDNVMGNDAAKMVEYGCLRTSHGFKATKFRERKGGSAGYEILEYKVYESSLVPIPANADAVITLHSRQKLHHPANKAWAEHLKAGLPKSVVGGFDGTKGATTVVACDCPKKQPSKTALGKKTPSAPARIGYDGTLWVAACLEDSWEWVADALEDQAKSFLKGANVKVGDYAPVCVVGTYDDYAILCVLSDGGDNKAAFYKAAWSMTAGEPTLTGVPEETAVTVEHDSPAEDKQKAFAGAVLGAKLLKMQVAKLKEARDHMAMVKSSPELKTTTKAFADTAHGLIHSVINTGKEKAARMTIAKLSRARELTHAVRTADELKAPAKTAADATHKLLGEILATMKGGEPDAVAVAAELCTKLRGGEALDRGAISALREEVSLAEERNLEAELAALVH